MVSGKQRDFVGLRPVICNGERSRLGFLEKGSRIRITIGSIDIKENSERCGPAALIEVAAVLKESGFAEPDKAALLPRKENAQSEPSSSSSANSPRTKHLRRNNGRRLIKSLAKARLQMPSPLEKSEGVEF